MEKVKIYTDGACSGNPGPGGWAAILISGTNEKEISGGEGSTTNNRMELTAAVEALRALKVQCEVTLFSDSAYLINAFQQRWLDSWKRHGWKRGPRKNEPVLNVDLWEELDRLQGEHTVAWKKVEGHAGHEYNERVDRLAVAAIDGVRS
jgi:ribonuclease HI